MRAACGRQGKVTDPDKKGKLSANLTSLLASKPSFTGGGEAYKFQS
jgi:hypothetical protein